MHWIMNRNKLALWIIIPQSHPLPLNINQTPRSYPTLPQRLILKGVLDLSMQSYQYLQTSVNGFDNYFLLYGTHKQAMVWMLSLTFTFLRIHVTALYLQVYFLIRQIGHNDSQTSALCPTRPTFKAISTKYFYHYVKQHYK